ncbi:MAG: hypothetical protein R3F20_00090 [Planctomycetota bacterium]
MTIEAAASKDNWLGEAEIKGRLRVTGCTGRNESPHLDYEYRPSGKMSAEGRRTVGDLAAARSSIWTRGDFAGRASFEETFRGCALRALPDDPDRIAVEGHREIASVKIEKDLPVEVVRKNGETLRYRFERKDGRLLPTATEWVFGDRVAVIETDFKKLASDFYYPSRVTMRDWFHAGWGPEVYTYRLKLE